MDLYLAREGKESGAGTTARKGGRGGGKFIGEKGKLWTVEEGPRPDSVTIVADKKSCRI